MRGSAMSPKSNADKNLPVFRNFDRIPWRAFLIISGVGRSGCLLRGTRLGPNTVGKDEGGSSSAVFDPSLTLGTNSNDAGVSSSSGEVAWDNAFPINNDFSTPKGLPMEEGGIGCCLLE